VLGLVLFNLHVGNIMPGLKTCKYVAYADDSNVINFGDNVDSVMENTKSNIQIHSEASRG